MRLAALFGILWLSQISYDYVAKYVRTNTAYDFENTVLPCTYNDKTVNINLVVHSSFDGEQRQDIFRGVCTAVKAFRSCKYLRKHYARAKKLGTKEMTSLPLFIDIDNDVEIGRCGYTYRDTYGHIWLNPIAWRKDLCDTPAQVIFHEFLHHTNLPNHVYNGNKTDVIDKITHSCIKE